jgi:hypothetical protein
MSALSRALPVARQPGQSMARSRKRRRTRSVRAIPSGIYLSIIRHQEHDDSGTAIAAFPFLKQPSCQTPPNVPFDVT